MRSQQSEPTPVATTLDRYRRLYALHRQDPDDHSVYLAMIQARKGWMDAWRDAHRREA
jgi:hypothetical protein